MSDKWDTPTLTQDDVRHVLTLVLDRVGTSVDSREWRLIGTASAVFRGLSLPAGDIDILARYRHVVDTFADRLRDFVWEVPPILLEERHQYFARFLIDGLPLEISTVEIESESDAIETYGRGPWRHWALVPCGDHEVPTIALEIRLGTELARQRRDRYEPIIKWLRLHGYDAALLTASCDASGVSERRQKEVISSLRDRAR